jgi:hypothetical protein
MSQEEHGDYRLIVVQTTAGPQSVWEWKVYKGLSGRIAARDRANSEEEAQEAGRRWIEGHSLR